jgi:hypothetical protein
MLRIGSESFAHPLASHSLGSGHRNRDRKEQDMSMQDADRPRSSLVSALRDTGFVIAAAALGIVAWGIFASLMTLVKSGAFNDMTAFQAGQAAARHALNVGGTIGALIGAFVSARRSKNSEACIPGLAGWIVAVVLTLCFIVAGMGAK